MSDSDYARIEQAILFLQANFRRQPRLCDIAAGVGLSEYHFQRLFRRWAGISPKRFVQYLTAGYAERRLQEVGNLLDTSLDAGLSGPGRLHDLMVNVHAVTPGEMKRAGEGLRIRHGEHASPFGRCLLAVTGRGICGLSFVGVGGYPKALAELRQRWPKADFIADREATGSIATRLFEPAGSAKPGSIDLFVQGSNFQIKVWEALLRIPAGSLVCYRDLASSIGSPGAARAVGSANAHNPVALLIPCHRVIRRDGGMGGYRWGNPRKLAIIGWEAAQRHGGD